MKIIQATRDLKDIKGTKTFKRRKKQRELSSQVLCNLLDVDSDITEVRSVDGSDSVVSSSFSISESDLQSVGDDRFCLIEKREKHKPPIALDCEMVGVGLNKANALARCSIVDYDGDVIYDAYVKPEKPITDYRTRWSGIRPSNLLEAVPFCEAREQVKRLIRKHILVGHSIQGDLKVLNLRHKNRLIRDTSKHIPLRILANFSPNMTPSLKRLSSTLLNKSIQQVEHCSVEDARATMSLYKLCETQWENDLNPVGNCKVDQYLQDAYWPEWTNRTK